MKTNLLSPPYVDCCRNRVSCSARLASILASPPGLLIITPVDLLFTRPDTERPPITMLERRPMARSQFTPATPCNFISQGAGPTSRQIHDPNLPSDGFLPYLSVCPHLANHAIRLDTMRHSHSDSWLRLDDRHLPDRLLRQPLHKELGQTLLSP